MGASGAFAAQLVVAAAHDAGGVAAAHVAGAQALLSATAAQWPAFFAFLPFFGFAAQLWPAAGAHVAACAMVGAIATDSPPATTNIAARLMGFFI
jgi:hypothetical protein